MNKNYALHEKVSNDPLLAKVTDDLTFNQFFENKNLSQPLRKIEFEDLKKCIWFCSILAKSEDENHRKKVQFFSSLAYLQNIGNLNVERACFILLSRVGNLTAARLFKNYAIITGQSSTSFEPFDAILDYELAHEWNDKFIGVGSENILMSRFQKGLWDNLNSGNRLSISAPTSAGKSFILKKYLATKFTANPSFRVLFIVPSKALINQVSEEFRKEVDLNDVEVKTAFLEEESDAYKNKEIYILTPERCLRLIQFGSKIDLKIDVVFVDEIQNIEDENGRGSLLEFVLRQLKEIFPEAQIIIAGPNISNTDKLFTKLFEETSSVTETSVSPVFQIKTIVRPVSDKRLLVTLKNITGSEQTFTLNTEIDFRKKINESYGAGFASFIDYFSSNNQNIIYSPRTDYVEDWALQYVTDTKVEYNIKDKETVELIEFLKEEIHPKYYLIKCLERRTAFHHSKLPDIVRKEIEDGYLESRITNLFCTSTLLEGVNLPANNLFIVSPKKLTEDLSPFEFGNLIGRAGRIRDNLFGTIYCIERDENNQWAEEYYDNVYKKEVQPVAEKALNDINTFLSNVDKPIAEIKDPKTLNTIIFLRHKFLKEPDSIMKYLIEKDVVPANRTRIIAALKESLNNSLLPSEISSLNPSIDPVLQNQLYVRIQADGLEKWAINPNSNFYSGIKKEAKDSYEFQSNSFYWQLVSVMERLDEIFGISKEIYFKHKMSSSIRQVCFYGLRWLDSKSYRFLIENDIAFYANHSNPEKKIDPDNLRDINRRINEVIKIYGTLVSYVLVKYMKLVNDVLESIMNDEEKERYKFSLGLPTMLELGSSEPIVKMLISRGVSRSVALKVWFEFKKVYNHDSLNVFQWLKTIDRLNLKPIYNRYLKRLKLLKET